MSRTLSLATTAFDSTLFQPVQLSGQEACNGLYDYTLILKTPDVDPIDFLKQVGVSLPHANIDLTAWLGHGLSVGIELDGKVVTTQERLRGVPFLVKEQVGAGIRHISGLITHARFLYNQGRSAYYAVTLQPFLANANLRSDYKIYQDLTVVEILEELLQAYPGTVVKRLALNQAHRYPKRAYVTQYGETDLAFFQRLCAEWGINYWFEHGAAGQSLVLSDDVTGHQAIESAAYHDVAYYPPNYKIAEEYLHELNLTAQMVSGAFASADYDYARTEQTLASHWDTQPYPEAADAKADGAKASIAQRPHEVYEYAAEVVQPKAGPMQASNDARSELTERQAWQLQREQQRHFSASAKGHIRGLATGHRFTVNSHPSALANREWTIAGTELLIMDLAEESQRKEQGLPSLAADAATLSIKFLQQAQGTLAAALTSNQAWQVICGLDLMPSNVAIRPLKQAKPQGRLQTAVVVGDESGEDASAVYTDYLGRIKVQFHWDRYGQKDQNSSCWVRVNEPWAGNKMGAVFTPRIGQEVLIDFINADPDRPVCMGKVNNSDNQPNWLLTNNQALSGFRSRELPAGNHSSGRSNHLVFDDTKEHIQTQLKSDHAHSQLSLGDITRVEDNQGRKDARGQGFELRTDDWGSARAAKGLYLTTFPREAADGAHMDAYEAQELLQQAQQLVKQLSKLANQHNAEALSGSEPLDLFSKVTESELPQHPNMAGLKAATEQLNQTQGQIDELNTLNSVLPNGLPNEVKAQATEKVLRTLAKEEARRPIKPTQPSLMDGHSTAEYGNRMQAYEGQMGLYQAQLKAYQNNPYDAARTKLTELDKLDKPQKTEQLLKDKEIQSIFNNMKTADGRSYGKLQEQVPPYSPEGFKENVLVGAGEAGIALVTPQDTHQYSQQKHTITTGEDVNVTTGNSWLASVANKLSFFVQQGIKVFSGKGKIEIQAHDNNIEIVADKAVKIISANDLVQMAASKEILMTCGGAYIRLNGGNIEIHAPGIIDQKAGSFPHAGPTSLNYELPKKIDVASGPYSAKYQLFKEDNRPFEGYYYDIKDSSESLLKTGISDSLGITEFTSTDDIKAIKAYKSIMRESERIIEPWEGNLEKLLKQASRGAE